MTPTSSQSVENFPLSPDCRQVIDRLQSVLDGELPATALEVDPHATACRTCRERIAAGKLVWNSLRTAQESSLFRAALTGQIVMAIHTDRQRQRRNRVRRRLFAGGLAIAAMLLIVIRSGWPVGSNQTASVQKQPTDSTLAKEPQAPAPVAAQPVQQPLRLADELSKAEQAFVNSSRPITDPARAAPQVIEKIADYFSSPDPSGPRVEFGQTALLELPEAARSGLQPVTETTQKAIARFFHDVSAIQTTPKPN